MDSEFIALSCINYAICLVDAYDIGIGEWTVPLKSEPEIELEVGPSEEEREDLMQVISRQVEDWVSTIGTQTRRFGT